MNLASLKSGPVTPAPQWARQIMLAAVLLYPVIGIRYLPFGNGGRYLSSITGPLALTFLVIWCWPQWRNLAREALAWLTPFLPYLVTYVFIMALHGLTKTEPNLLSRLLWAVVIYLAAMQIGLQRRHLFWAAAAGSLAYFGAAIWDIAVLHLVRAAGGANEVHFAFVGMWLSGLSAIGAGMPDVGSRSEKRIWLIAALCGVLACLLSGTRAALLALVPLYLLALRMAHQRERRLLYLSVAVLSSAVLAAIFVHQPLENRIEVVWHEAEAYYTQANFHFSSIGARLEIWRVGWLLFLEHPMLGSGFTSFAALTPVPPALNGIDPEVLKLPHFHNDWIHALVFGGAALFAAQLATVVLLARAARGDPARMWILFAALAFGLADIVFHGKVTLTFLAGSWAVFAAAQSNAERKESDAAARTHPLPG